MSRLSVGASLLVRLLQLSLAGTAYVAYDSGDTWLVVTAVLALAVTLLPALLERNRRVSMNVWLVLAITVAVVVHTAGTVGAYRTITWFDDVAHVTSASVVAAIGYATARSLDVHSEHLRLTPKFTFFYLFVFVMAAGVVWELLEFSVTTTADRFDLATPRLQTGLEDTVTDLIYDAVGAMLVALFGTMFLTDAVRFGSTTDSDTGERV